MKQATKRRATALLKRLKKAYPRAHCELDFASPFQLLVATILSAQCTDKAVNAATPALFKAFPDAAALAQANVSEVEGLIQSIGLFRGKAKHIVAAAGILVEKYKGKVPSNMAALVALPGVGRKTANVVLYNGFGLPGLAVDTHVLRVGKRLGLLDTPDPVRAEEALHTLLAPEDWGICSHLLIWHGRRVCFARSPNCGGCVLQDLCPSAFKAG